MNLVQSIMNDSWKRGMDEVKARVENTRYITAGEVAGDPDLFNDIYSFGGHTWECMGFTKSMKSVKFQRLESVKVNGQWKLRVKTRYIKPGVHIVHVGVNNG